MDDLSALRAGIERFLDDRIGNTKDESRESKYILYARKSTSSSDHQEHSIDDQIKDCYVRCINPDGLNVIKIFKEEESARNAGTRPLFRKMLNMIQDGEADGIITWHPDRLSRNMKEAGEIIDLLDKEAIKDLRFATSTFENNPTGKMLLGIAFVLAKQYSEHLSENVSRGNREHVARGEYLATSKHGYRIIRTSDLDRLYPDEENFQYIKEAFRLRLTENRRLEDIADYLNSSGYKVHNRRVGHKSFKWSKSKVSALFKDAIYAGFLVYGTHQTYLPELYDFTPVITLKEFTVLNPGVNLGETIAVKGKRTGLATQYAYKMVTCGYCGGLMTPAPQPKKLATGDKVSIFYFRCENAICRAPKRNNTRARVILDFVISFLKANAERLSTPEVYEMYKREKEEAVKEVQRKFKDLMGVITKKEKELSHQLNLTKDKISHSDDEALTRILVENVQRYEKQLEGLQDDKFDITTKRDQVGASMLSLGDFLEFMQKSATTLEKTNSLEVVDGVTKILFSNFVVKDKSISDYKLKEPFERVLLVDRVHFGRGART